MKIKFVYKFLPVLVFYIDKSTWFGKWMFKKKYLGFAVYNIIFIRKTQQNNKCLLQHELTHVKQMYRTLGLHGVLYRYVDKYRFNAEAEAYAYQVVCKGGNTKYTRAFAKLLSRLYDLDYNFVECYRKIEDYICKICNVRVVV